jgi:hypothetical protein
MLRRWLGGGKSPQTVRVGGVLLRGEQDGVPERDLKRELTALFQSRSDVESAYLAVVSYEGGSAHGKALCITGVIERADRPEIAKAVSKIFAGMFGAHEHLDIVFPTDAQKGQLVQVCQPFFVRGIPAIPVADAP